MMRFTKLSTTLGALMAFVMFASLLNGAEPDKLRQKQQAQEKARALAGELVSGVLEIQIRQLSENGLKDLPIYRDIASMKGSLHELMRDDMEQIVTLLLKAQEGTQKERLVQFEAAHAKSREVVVRLLAERQKLFRRDRKSVV